MPRPRPPKTLFPVEFFDGPLYAEYRLPDQEKQKPWIFPSFKRQCKYCGDEQTFVFQDTGDITDRIWDWYPDGCGPSNIVQVMFNCAACSVQPVYFFVRLEIDGHTVRKVGQYPQPSVNAPKDVARFLGKDVDYYTKARISETHGFGIGASAYYRRIVENYIGQLLDKLRELASDNDTKFIQAIEEAQKTIVAQKKIELVKGYLPSNLRPEGQANPLGTLHDALSEGIHALTDEQCLKRATDIRRVLNYFITQIAAHDRAKQDFKEGMDNLATGDSD